MLHPTELALSLRQHFNIETEHPAAQLEQTQSSILTSRRGRKRKHPVVIKDPNTPKGKRGRKPLSEEEKTRRAALVEVKPKNPNGTGKRGRPPMPEHLKKPKVVKPVVEGVRRRGRPSIAPELRKNKPYVPNGGKRGRPAKIKTV